jgi:hypothetical protein
VRIAIAIALAAALPAGCGSTDRTSDRSPSDTPPYGGAMVSLDDPGDVERWPAATQPIRCA